jgi:hypothetical protein
LFTTYIQRKPRQDIFLFKLLIRQADYMVEATELMLAYLDKPGKKRRKKRDAGRKRLTTCAAVWSRS